MAHSIKKGIIYSKKGIPEAPRWFADNRLSFEFGEYGITRVQYINPMTRQGNSAIFLQRLWDGFRYYIEKDMLTYKPEYSNNTVWPFGIESQWDFQGAKITHSVLAVEECIVIQLKTPDAIPDNLCVKLEFYEAFGLTPTDNDDCRFVDMGAVRQWDKWAFDKEQNILCGGFTDIPKVSTDDSVESKLAIGISGDFKIEHIERTNGIKHILKSESLYPNTTYNFIITFVYDSDVLEKTQLQLGKIQESINKQFERYNNVSKKSPILISKYKKLNDFISLAPMFHESCKVTYIPGAIRASNVLYWVWGWDGMTSNYGTFYWGDENMMKNMLDMYQEYSHPERGIVHSFRNDMSIQEYSPYPAQGMYICLLQQYYAMTGDVETVRKHYAFAKKIFSWNIEKEVGDTGFCQGTSLFPDDRKAMLETGNDISAFNNTVFYCSLRSMEYLAILLEDGECAGKASKMFKCIEENFSKLFFDDEKGFVVTSVDSQTFSQRESYSLNSIKWENSYLAELMEPLNNKCIDFIEKHLISKAGLREMPVWNVAFDMDGNQHHCWWPVNSEYFIKTVNENNRKELVETFVNYIQKWISVLTVPEGVSYYIETDDIEFDRWNMLKGVWQAYNIRGWYQAVIHGVFGMTADVGGITFYPYSGEEMKLKGLHYMDKIFDMEMKGSGKYITDMVINGVSVKGTNKLPVDLYGDKKKVKIIINRTEICTHDLYIVSGYGVELLSYYYSDTKITSTIKGFGTCRLKIFAMQKPMVKLDNEIHAVVYDEINCLATVEIYFENDHTKKVEIKLFSA